MRLLHISDTHIGGKGDFDREVLLKITQSIDFNQYDFMIHTGDITQSGKEEQYIEGKNYLQKIPLPYLVIPGNHDARSGGIALFNQYIGPTNGVRTFGDAVVIFVNSAVADTNDGRVGMVKFDLLKNSLNKYQDFPVRIVAIHHHTIPTPRAGRERNVLYNAGDMLDLMLHYDVDLVLSGHRHYPNVYRVNNTVFVNAGTVSCRKTRYGDLYSYNSIAITNRKLSIETKRIDNSAEKKVFPRQEKRIFKDFGTRQTRIVQLSNTMISDSRHFLTNHFSNAVQTINHLEADIAVHCGGIVAEGITAYYNLARKYLSQIKIPLVFSPAGRDINYLGYNLFPRFFGSLDQNYRNEHLLLQGVFSSQYDSPVGIIGETERHKLFQTLQDRDEPYLGIFLHHNVTPIPHAREKGLLEDAGDFLRGAVDAEIDLILTGTSSHPYAVRVGNTVIVNANSLSGVHQRSIYGNSFNIVDIYDYVTVVSEINSLWGTRRIIGMWRRKNSI